MKLLRTLACLAALAPLALTAQDVMTIHKTDGTTLVFPVAEVDSVSYVPYFPLPYSAPLNEGDFAVSDVSVPAAVGSVWIYAADYSCMKATAFARGKAYAAESWLVSPLISLEGVATASLTFEHAGRYFGNMQEDVGLYIQNADDGDRWERLPIDAYPTSWTFVTANVSLTAYAGQLVRIAFAYTSTAEAAGTWEVRNVAISGTPAADGLQAPGGFFEVPAVSAEQLSDPDTRYVEHTFTYANAPYRSYEMLYDASLRMAYWVAYPLCQFYTASNVSRTNNWGYDTLIPQSEQALLKKGITGYDRGHQIPSADRLVCDEANSQTFFYTNMTPQLGTGFNQSIWANLESAVRTWASRTDTLYVVTGAIPNVEGTSLQYAYDNTGAPMCVPQFYYKALCKLNRSTGHATTIAFLLPHESYARGSSYLDHTCSVAELEDVTGFKFFPAVADEDKETYSTADW